MSQPFKYPAMLSYRASIIPSLFAFYSLEQGENVDVKTIDTRKLEPIEVVRSTLRTTLANYVESSKIAAAFEKGGANIQTIEKTTLPPNADTLVIQGNVKFYGNSLTPEATNESDFIPFAAEYLKLFSEKIGFNTLAERYFLNLINGTILWRNKYGQVQTFIKVENIEETFDLDEESELANSLTINSIKNTVKRENAQKIIDKISDALAGKKYITINVLSKIFLGVSQTVYASQEFDETKEVSKSLAKAIYQKNNKMVNQAVFHEQKIGNAIRTIDTWHTDVENAIPLAIEPYGISQKESKAKRINKNSFYDYFMKLDKLIDDLKSDKFDVNKHNYVVACLIRGGVYSGAKKKSEGE